MRTADNKNIQDLVEEAAAVLGLAGARAVVTGGIRLVDVFGNRNPQPVWAGLIHEDVAITEFNNRVDPQAILVDIPDAANMPTCEPREIPMKPE